ncbi:MAG: hypothetical protein JWP85_2135 [Rhodoglobus sp.]|nr:hypothetical protein [Rhodoglobus sp.]
MSTFSERLAAAKVAPRKTKDVSILLDTDLAEQREALRDQIGRVRAIADADQRLSGGTHPAEVLLQEQLDKLLADSAESLITLRFARLSGDAWSEITARCPVRPDAPIDRQYGYNMHAVCKLAAPISGARVDGEDLVPLLVTPASEGVPAVDEWSDLFNTISGHEMVLIIDAIYDLNAWDPAMQVSSLKKELATRPA